MRALFLTVAVPVTLVSLACSGSGSGGGEPRYGTVTLEGGFLPDPHDASVAAGGFTSTTDAGWPSSCVGYVEPDAPDYRLELSDFSEVYVAACSDSDISLAIKGPDGTWHCDDDSEGTNPVVSLGRASGTYDVWVGVYSEANVATSTLRVTESNGSICTR